MIDLVAAMSRAIEARIAANGVVRAMGDKITQVAMGHLRLLIGKEYHRGEHVYITQQVECTFSANDYEYGEAPVHLTLLLHRKGLNKVERRQAYAANANFKAGRWFAFDNKSTVYLLRRFSVSVEEAVAGDYCLSMK